MVLAKVLGTQVRQLILDLDVVDADLAQKVSQHDVLCARIIGAVAGDVQR